MTASQASSQASSQGTSGELPLPPGIESIRSILDIDNSRLDTQPMVNVIGLVRDYQPPTETRGTDMKSTISIIDLSTQEGPGIRMNLFYKRDKMPRVSGAGDVMIVRKVKVQMHRGAVSLLGNWASEFNVFTAAKLPLWPIKHPMTLAGAMTAQGRVPSHNEANYMVWLYHHIDTKQIPTAEEFKEKTVQAMNKEDKYSLCKNLKADRYHDLIGEVIRSFDDGHKMTLHISDYTAHPLFFQHVWSGDTSQTSGARDGDEYGYMKSRVKAEKDWPGPFGKMSMQITVFNDLDARLMRDQVKPKDWISIRNVCTKISQSGCMEGVLRDDIAFPDRVHFEILRKPEDPELVDPLWKEAVRRKKQWWEKFEKQKKKFLEDTGGRSGAKRKNEDDGNRRGNSKARRKAKLANAEQKLASGAKKAGETGTTGQKEIRGLDLNVNIKCNHPQVQPVPVSVILDPKRNRVQLEGGEEFVVPFLNTKFRANVRVVDFWPHKLEDFAVGRRISDYDILSDNSGGESTDNEEDMKLFRAGKGFGGERKWEWRFALQVEDASIKATSPAERMWLLVDHQSAQMLLNVDEATNLRTNETALSDLREALFTLWGDLEEQKSALLKTAPGKTLRWASSANRDRTPIPNSDSDTSPNIEKPALDLPPPTSDDDDEPATTFLPPRPAPDPDRSASTALLRSLSTAEASARLSAAVWALPVTNKPFTCCVHEYGVPAPVQVSDAESEKATTGEGEGEGVRWMRMFGLFGTMIV